MSPSILRCYHLYPDDTPPFWNLLNTILIPLSSPIKVKCIWTPNFRAFTLVCIRLIINQQQDLMCFSFYSLQASKWLPLRQSHITISYNFEGTSKYIIVIIHRLNTCFLYLCCRHHHLISFHVKFFLKELICLPLTDLYCCPSIIHQLLFHHYLPTSTI